MIRGSCHSNASKRCAISSAQSNEAEDSTYPSEGGRPGVRLEPLTPDQTGTGSSHEVGVVPTTVATQMTEAMRGSQREVGQEGGQFVRPPGVAVLTEELPVQPR